MASVTAFTDAAAVARAWANDAATGIAGAGMALTNGVHLSQRNGAPGHATYAVVTRLPSSDADGGGPWDEPRLSFAVYGPDKIRAELAARSLANALRSIAGKPKVVTASGTLMWASRITVSDQPDGTHARYIVDADLGVAPA